MKRLAFASSNPWCPPARPQEVFFPGVNRRPANRTAALATFHDGAGRAGAARPRPALVGRGAVREGGRPDDGPATQQRPQLGLPLLGPRARGPARPAGAGTPAALFPPRPRSTWSRWPANG